MNSISNYNLCWFCETPCYKLVKICDFCRKKKVIKNK